MKKKNQKGKCYVFIAIKSEILKKMLIFSLSSFYLTNDFKHTFLTKRFSHLCKRERHYHIWTLMCHLEPLSEISNSIIIFTKNKLLC